LDNFFHAHAATADDAEKKPLEFTHFPPKPSRIPLAVVDANLLKIKCP